MPLVKRGNSKFWYVQFQLNHRTIIRSTRTTDRKVAERLEAKIRSEAHDEIVMGKKKPITLGAALALFLRSKEGTANYANLVSTKRTILKIMKGTQPLGSLRNEDLELFKRERMREGCKPQTVKHGMNVIMSAIRLARRNGFEVADVVPPTIKVGSGMTRYLSVEEEGRLLAELDPLREGNGLARIALRSAKKCREMQDNYDLVVLLLDTGARYSEIANIRWSQLDLEARTIRLWRSKVQNESTLYMSDCESAPGFDADRRANSLNSL